MLMLIPPAMVQDEWSKDSVVSLTEINQLKGAINKTSVITTPGFIILFNNLGVNLDVKCWLYIIFKKGKLVTLLSVWFSMVSTTAM